jgi:hypothetical protein
MIAAAVVQTDSGYHVRLTEAKDGQVVWQKFLPVDEALFLMMEIDEVVKTHHLGPPPRGRR